MQFGINLCVGICEERGVVLALTGEAETVKSFSAGLAEAGEVTMPLTISQARAVAMQLIECAGEVERSAMVSAGLKVPPRGRFYGAN